MKKIWYVDVDGVLADFHNTPHTFKDIASREWIANLPPFMHNVDTVNALIASGESVYIISKVVNKSAKQGRIEWLKKYLPMLPKHRIILLVGSGNKANYRKTKKGTLIDDDIKNCKQWSKAGLEYIHIVNKGDMIEGL